MKLIISGKARDCLADFFKRFGRQEALWKFTKVVPQTEGTWRLGKAIPTGDTYLRVLYFLDLIGYKVGEIEENISSELRILGQCIAMDLLSVEWVAHQCGLHTRHLYRYFRGENKSSPLRNSQFTAIVEPHTEALEKALVNAKSELKGLGLFVTKTTSESVVMSNEDMINFSNACMKVREFGQKLLDGDVQNRIEMRRRMCEGRDPELQLTWQVLNSLLNERKN